MTDLKLMESKEPTYEVVSTLSAKDLSGSLSIHTDKDQSGWFIRVMDKEAPVEQTICLTGAEAIALSEFIAAHVRKRW